MRTPRQVFGMYKMLRFGLLKVDERWWHTTSACRPSAIEGLSENLAIAFILYKASKVETQDRISEAHELS